jgi:GDP-L-fucose synthase
VGGIEYNRTHPGTLLYDNAMMSLNLLEAGRIAGIKKFVGVGSVCEYPAQAQVPFQENRLWDGYPETSNGAYGLAKRLMLAQGRAYKDEFGLNSIHLLLINLFGPGDHYNPERSHVITALTNKLIDAKELGQAAVTVWGTGRATREFLYVDDAARAVVLATEKYDRPEPVNVGSGQEIAIRTLAENLKEIIGYQGELVWDSTKPDGQLRRCLDITLADREFGFRATTPFLDGLRSTVEDVLRQRKEA